MLSCTNAAATLAIAAAASTAPAAAAAATAFTASTNPAYRDLLLQRWLSGAVTVTEAAQQSLLVIKCALIGLNAGL